MVKKKCDQEKKPANKKDGEQIEEMQLGTARIKQKPKKQRKQGTTQEKSYIEKAKSYTPKIRKLVSKKTKKDLLDSKQKELDIQEREPNKKDITSDIYKIQKQDRGAPRKGCRWKTKIQILHQVLNGGKRTNDDNHNPKIISKFNENLNPEQKQQFRKFKPKGKQISVYNFIRFLQKKRAERKVREKFIKSFSKIKKQMTKTKIHKIYKPPKKMFKPQQAINSIIKRFKKIVKDAYFCKNVDFYQNIINCKINDHGIANDQISSNSRLLQIQIDCDEKFKNLDNEYTNDQWYQIFSNRKEKEQKQFNQKINHFNYSQFESFCKESKLFKKKANFVTHSDQQTNQKNLLKFIKKLSSEQLKVIEEKYNDTEWKDLKKNYEIINKIQKQLIKLQQVLKKQQNNNDSSEKNTPPRDPREFQKMKKQQNQTRGNKEAMQEQHPSLEDFSQNGFQQIQRKYPMAYLEKQHQQILQNGKGHQEKSMMDQQLYPTTNSTQNEMLFEKNQNQKTKENFYENFDEELFNVLG